jgi:hypothetical protein
LPVAVAQLTNWNGREDALSSLAVELGGRARRSFEDVRSELEFRLDPVVQEFDMEERVKDLREDPRAVQRLSHLLGFETTELLARLKETHGKTLLGSLLPELRQGRTTAERPEELDSLYELEEEEVAPRAEQDALPSAGPTLTQLLGESLAVEDAGSAWPAHGVLRIADRSYQVSVYARIIGGSSRGNDLERRFQNPSQRNPIVDDPTRYEMLLGLWVEQGSEKAVIVAFDPNRRVGRTTRFSLFMPLALLEQAADTGFATHETSSGEVRRAHSAESSRLRFETLAGELQPERRRADATLRRRPVLVAAAR